MGIRLATRAFLVLFVLMMVGCTGGAPPTVEGQSSTQPSPQGKPVIANAATNNGKVDVPSVLFNSVIVTKDNLPPKGQYVKTKVDVTSFFDENADAGSTTPIDVTSFFSGSTDTTSA